MPFSTGSSVPLNDRPPTPFWRNCTSLRAFGWSSSASLTAPFAENFQSPKVRSPPRIAESIVRVYLRWRRRRSARAVNVLPSAAAPPVMLPMVRRSRTSSSEKLLWNVRRVSWPSGPGRQSRFSAAARFSRTGL